MDLYLPALPSLTVELGAATSIAQLTITACLLGLAAGQLIAGPLSDRFGRRGILLIGIVAYVVTSAAVRGESYRRILDRCPAGARPGRWCRHRHRPGRRPRHLYRWRTDSVLWAPHRHRRLRCHRGPATGRGAQHSHRLARPIPVPRGDWCRDRCCHLADVPRDPSRQPPHCGGFCRRRAGFRTLLADRTFVGAVLNQGFLYAALFAYLAGATFVLQDIYGLSPQGYALAFGLNSAGSWPLGYLAGRFSERWSVPGTLTVGTAVAGFGALGLLTSGLIVLPLWMVLLSFFTLACGVAIRPLRPRRSR